MRGTIAPLPQHAFMVWCSVKKKHRDNFTFSFTLSDFCYYIFFSLIIIIFIFEEEIFIVFMNYIM
jgi:hypothetical protein